MRPDTRIWRYWSPEQYTGYLSEIDPGLRDMYSSAAVDTYNIVWYDFEDIDCQGWTPVNNNTQVRRFFHADDFAGLDGGDFGRLVPINGSKSIWCGARPGTDSYMCGWRDAPGYGNNWDQWFWTYPQISINSGVVNFTYHGVFDSESGYDITYVEYANTRDDWVVLDAWSGTVDTVVTHEIYPMWHMTKLRFRFVSDDAGSDQDGGINTDGACIIDDIVVADGSGVIPWYTDDFENWGVGSTGGIFMWAAGDGSTISTYAGLWTGLQDKDPCNDNFTSQIVFFNSWCDPSASYPGLYDTPFCFEYSYGMGEICQNEMVVSPVIDLTKYSTANDEVQDADIPTEDIDELGGALMRFTIYGDLPYSNMVFANWSVRNVDETGCPGMWRQLYTPTYFTGSLSGKQYYFIADEIGQFIEEDRIQVALICVDLCAEMYAGPLSYCEDHEHTPAPWFDDVRIQRYKRVGPQWSYRAYNLFQDNFPEDQWDVESHIRADAADDKAAGTDPYFIPGDSIVIICSSPLGGGINEGGVTGGGEVYLHVRCTDISGWLGKPNLYGPTLEGDYGAYVSDDGVEWTIIQCDTARTQYVNPVPDMWCADLNDALLTRGYMVEYYFSVMDNAGNVATLPEGGAGGAAGPGLTSGPAKMFEFTCLPTGRSEVLYVDDFDGRGCQEGIVELYFHKAFWRVIYDFEQPDRYDVNSPSSMVGNGLASRATLQQLMHDDINISGYRIIIWDSGDLDVGTIGDGNPAYEKTNDCLLLCSWLDQSENDVGFLVCGDNIAYDLSENLGSVPAIMLMSTWCGVDHLDASYFDMTGGFDGGGIVNPLVTGMSTGIFWHDGDPIQFYLEGGCPVLGSFDVIEALSSGTEALVYPDYDGGTYVAGVQSEQTTATDHTARTMWLGFSFMNIRDDEPAVPIDRVRLFADVYQWFGGIPDPYPYKSGGETPAAYRLAQNYPNPFNPVTTIKFDIREKGQVSLKIYNVAGQLVRTLVDGELEAGSYAEDWKGLNDGGSKVASGVYFYRLESGTFESVKKMVLLR